MTNSPRSQSEKQWASTGRETTAEAAEQARGRREPGQNGCSEEAEGAAQNFPVSRVAEARRLYSWASIRSCSGVMGIFFCFHVHR